ERDRVDKVTPAGCGGGEGNIAGGGFEPAEPYIYENEVNGWKKPVKLLLLDPDVPIYQNTFAIRADKLEANRACLKALIPLMQQAAVDYIKNPGPVNSVLVDYTAKIKGGTQITTAGSV